MITLSDALERLAARLGAGSVDLSAEVAMWIVWDDLEAWSLAKKSVPIRFHFPADSMRPVALLDALAFMRAKGVHFSASAIENFDPDSPDNAGRFLSYAAAKDRIESAWKAHPWIDFSKVIDRWRKLHADIASGQTGVSPRVVGHLPCGYPEKIDDGLFRERALAEFIAVELGADSEVPRIVGGKRFWTITLAVACLREMAGFDSYRAELIRGAALVAVRKGYLHTRSYPDGGIVQGRHSAGIGARPIYVFAKDFNAWLDGEPNVTVHRLPPDSAGERPADWSHWSLAPTLRVWEAALLSLDIEPDPAMFEREPALCYTTPTLKPGASAGLQRDFPRRLDMLGRYLDDPAVFSSVKLAKLGRDVQSEVSTPQFAALAASLWTNAIPASLRALAPEKAQGKAAVSTANPELGPRWRLKPSERNRAPNSDIRRCLQKMLDSGEAKPVPGALTVVEAIADALRRKEDMDSITGTAIEHGEHVAIEYIDKRGAACELSIEDLQKRLSRLIVVETVKPDKADR